MSPGRTQPSLRLVRPALPLGGVPRAAGQRLQRRLHRRDRCHDLDGDGLDDLGAGQLRCASERPAADDQGDGLRGHVARRSGRHALRRRHRAAARAQSPCPPARRTRSTSRSSITATARSTARSSSTISRSRRRPAATAPRSLTPVGPPVAITGPAVGCDSRHAHADAHGHRDRARRRDGQDLPGPRRGRDSRADAGGHALRRHVVGARGVAGPGPVHGAGHAGRRQRRRRRERATTLHGRAGRRRRWPARASPAGSRRPGRRRHPGRPGHLRRLAAAGARQDLRRTRRLGRGLHQVPAGQGPAPARRRGSCP